MDQSQAIISIHELIFAQIDKRNVIHVELLVYCTEGASFNVQLVKRDVEKSIILSSSCLDRPFLHLLHKFFRRLLLLEADCGFRRIQILWQARFEIIKWIAICYL